VLLNWTWSYLSYRRGARLITSTGWKPDLEAEQAALSTRHRPPSVDVVTARPAAAEILT
jgi:hypothetical protein